MVVSDQVDDDVRRLRRKSSLTLYPATLDLDCGPMSGFDNARVDAEFFPGGKVRSNFLCNLGYGDPATLRPRAPRLAFDDACWIE